MKRHTAGTLLLAATLAVAAAAARAGAYDDLIVAVTNDDTATVENLIGRGMDVNSVDASGTTLLMHAARQGNRELVEFLLANRASLAKRNKYGDNAMLMAALGGDVAILTLLADAGGEINPAAGWTPLLYAAFDGKLDAMRFLLSRHANVNARSGSGMTPLMLAARGGHLEAARLLLDNGANASVRNQGGDTALDLAVKQGQTQIADLIRGQGAAAK